MFIPDPGHEWYDMDLDRADLQVVVWEADDQMLKAALRQGSDIHLLNAYVLQMKEPPPLEELVERHKAGDPCICGPRCYWDYRRPLKAVREFAKTFYHGTNYLGQPRTMAAHTGRTVHEIDRAQKIWFGAHPGIKTWHERTKAQAIKHRFVENRFGYRWYLFDRIESILPEIVAWTPQSTVSIVINKIWHNLYKQAPEVEVNLQVHDSLCGQYKIENRARALASLKAASNVVVPYPDPLVIPTGIKTSTVSWGDVA